RGPRRGRIGPDRSQSLRGDDHGHGEDRQPVDRRYRVRQPRDAGCLRSRPHTLHLHAWAERAGPLHRAQIPGAVRMTDAVAETDGKSLLAPDARTRRRNASERRFRMMGLVAVTVGVLALLGLL